VTQTDHAHDVHVVVQTHNCRVLSFANVMIKPVSITGLHRTNRETVTMKKTKKKRLKMLKTCSVVKEFSLVPIRN